MYMTVAGGDFKHLP